jgi:hypothetical protein
LISMQGRGSVNFRRELDLELVANVGRRGIVGALVRPFTQNPNANWMRATLKFVPRCLYGIRSTKCSLKPLNPAFLGRCRNHTPR